MAEVNLTAAFSTVPAGDAEAIKRLLVETVEQIARDDGSFQKAKLVFTESDERCGLTAELDGVKKEGVPLPLDLEQLEDAKTSAGDPPPPKEAPRLYLPEAGGVRVRRAVFSAPIAAAAFGCPPRVAARSGP